MTLTSFDGKTAFVTGGANGIGFGVAKALIGQGANVMLGDIDQEGLAAAKDALGPNAESTFCDVADPESVKQAADRTVARFGKVHLVFNNAGVGAGGEPGENSLEDWRWVVDINLLGVVYGVEIFVPLIKAHGEGGYIVNTASLAGHAVAPGTGSMYNATKFAVVGYSETLRLQLEPHGIGCSVLCPAWVDTKIHESGFRAPSNKGLDVSAAKESDQYKMMDAVLKSGLSADFVGAYTLDCILEGRMTIFTHPDFLSGLEARWDSLRADYNAANRDPRIKPTSGS